MASPALQRLLSGGEAREVTSTVLEWQNGREGWRLPILTDLLFTGWVYLHLRRNPARVFVRGAGTPRRIPPSLNSSEVANLAVYFGHGQRRHRPR
jgi:hypothetical protein